MRIEPAIYAALCAAALSVGGCAPLAKQPASRLAIVEAAPPSQPVRAVRPQLIAQLPPGEAEPPPRELLPPPPTSSRGVPRPVLSEPPEPDAPGARPVPMTTRQDDGLRPIGAVTVAIAPPKAVGANAADGGLPEDLALKKFGDAPPVLFGSEPFKPWDAYGQLVLSSDFCHQPLYFEDVNLERYGRSHGIFQPVISAVRFYTAVPSLPYKMVAEPPNVCMKDNSRWPAGAIAPRHRNLPPFDIKAGVVEAAVIVGLILIFP
ncbi:MAG TPA: hypothetical protein VL096_16860 [Pirellulaceae bacterium]|nr:hypothetical protein [Pirellulaceae bacterium]